MFRQVFMALLISLSATLSSSQAASDRLEFAASQTSRATQALLLDIAQAGERLVAVGEQGIILYSDDHGENWTQAEVPVSVMLTAVSFTSAKQGWAVGHDGVLLQSTDAGASWQFQMNGDQFNRLRFEQLQQYVAEQQAIGADEELLEELSYAVDDAEVAVQEGATNPLLDVFFTSATDGYLLGGYGMLWRTQDGGNSWQSLDHLLDNPDRFHLNAMLQTTAGNLLIVGEAGLLRRSDDNGQSWQWLGSPYEGSFFAAAQQRDLYVMGLRGHLFSSVQGDDWQEVELPRQATLSGAITTPEQLLLVGQGGVLLQRQSAEFTEITTPSRRSFSAGIASGDQLVLVGEGGITRLPLPARQHKGEG